MIGVRRGGLRGLGQDPSTDGLGIDWNQIISDITGTIKPILQNITGPQPYYNPATGTYGYPPNYNPVTGQYIQPSTGMSATTVALLLGAAYFLFLRRR